MGRHLLAPEASANLPLTLELAVTSALGILTSGQAKAYFRHWDTIFRM
jgi:hypothetical protein